MANPRKHTSAEDDDDVVASHAKRRMQAKSTGGGTRAAPIDLESVASQRQNKATPGMGAHKKSTPGNCQRGQTPRPGTAQQGGLVKQRHKELRAKPVEDGDDYDVTQTQAPPAAPPAPPRTFEITRPFPTLAQFRADEFPIFADADVFVVLSEEHMFWLHSSSLNRPVPWFKEDALRRVYLKEIRGAGGKLPVWEGKEWLDFTTMRKYLLTEKEDGQGFYLNRVPFTQWKVVPKPPVVDEKEVENKESAPGQPVDATKTPGMQNVDSNPAPNQPALAAANGSKIQNGAQAGSVMNGANNHAAGTQQASAPPGTQGSQTASAASSSQASSAPSRASSSQNLSPARPAPKMKVVKQEDGTVVKVEEADEDDPASSATPGPQRQLGIDLDTLPEHNGRRVLEMHGEMHYIEAVDPADPQQLTAQNTINLSGLVYRVTRVENAQPAAPAAELEPQPQEDEDEDIEDITEPLPPNPCPPLNRVDIIFGFTSLFSIIYNHPSSISSTSILHCITQCESLIAAANSLGALRVVTAHIGNAIMNFGKAVYIAILQNPRRWLKLSVEIGHDAIFAEAVCHVVGAWPDVVSESYFSMLNRATVQLLEKKALELRLKVYEVNEKLFAASLEIGADAKSLGRIELDKDNTQSFDTWLVVQLWRDWYSNQLSVARVPRTPETIAKAPRNYVFLDTLTKLGGLFRVLNAGGDAYLAKAEVEKLLKAYRARQPRNDIRMNGFLHFLDWEQDLNRMKEHAKEAVKNLMANNSMLTPQEQGLLYFTCTKVEEGESPWEVEAREKKTHGEMLFGN